ncbi:MAG: helix-turn-helix domain-containing protein [Muribaculaceae bacterium]|nr:helix-turn-helix domain-containing protein [Muribaculaceae bacterium]
MKNFSDNLHFYGNTNLRQCMRTALYVAWRCVVVSIFVQVTSMVTVSASQRKFQEFVSVNGSNGIPLSGITALTVDDNGFVWGASRMGIIRATPSNVKMYELPVSTSDVMQMKLAYNKGVLCAATQNGKVFRYDVILDRFEPWFSISDTLGTTDWISNLVIDSNGTLWASTSLGIFSFSDNILHSPSSEISGYSYLLPISGHDMFAIVDGKLYSFSDIGESKSILSGKFESYVSSACYDPYRERVLLGTYQGELWEYSLKEDKISRIGADLIPGAIIRTILAPDSDTILIGMEGRGIIVLDTKDRKDIAVIREDIDNPTSLKGNSVFAMLTDRQGRLWVATTSAGLQYSYADGDDAERIVHRYNTSSSLHNNEINFLLTDRNGNLWVATNDGISRRDVHDGSWHQMYGGRQLSVLSLTEDMQGRIYASTYGDGIYVLDPGTCKETGHFTGKDAEIFGKGAYVFASFTDSDGDVWFGGVKGDIVCYSPKTGKFTKYEPHPVFCFAEEKPGVILTGGGDGLISIDKKTGKSKTLLSDNVVQQVNVDESVWWICTSGNGVICMERRSGASRALTVNDGLHSNFTRSLIKQDGKLWIGTALGMSCYDIDKGVMLQLPGKDILTSDAFRENSSCIFPDGKLAFGTNNGIVTFRPDKILNVNNQGKIFFSDIKISVRSIRTDFDSELTVPIDSLEELKLNYPRNSFTLSMQALGNVSSNVMYSWRLDGVDKDWTEPMSVSSINYINLDPGVYSLKIRMYDGGIVSERELSVRVNPPFWKTIWFRILMILATVGLAVIMARQYVLSMHRRHAFEKLLLYLQVTENTKSKELPYKKEDRTSIMPEGMPEEIKDADDTAGATKSEGDKSIQVKTTSEPTETNDKNVIDNEFLAKAMECVRENISNEVFGKGDFASAMMISQSLLYKKIKAATDMSVVEFIRSIRLNHAMTLLNSGKYNVTEVSEMCGFSSSAYFSRVFKEGFGKSPSEIIPKNKA